MRTIIVILLASVCSAIEVESLTEVAFDLLEPCDGKTCPDGSWLDEKCCKCIVEPCIQVECMHEHEAWDPVQCKCVCRLALPAFSCPAGSYLKEDCCECVMNVNEDKCTGPEVVVNGLPYDDTKVAATGDIWQDEFKRSIASSENLDGVEIFFDSYEVTEDFFCARTEPIYLKAIDYQPYIQEFYDFSDNAEPAYVSYDAGYCQRMVFANGVSEEKSEWFGPKCSFSDDAVNGYQSFDLISLNGGARFSTLSVNQGSVKSPTQPDEYYTNFFVTLDVIFDGNCVPQVAVPFDSSNPETSQINCSLFNDDANDQVSCNSDNLLFLEQTYVCGYNEEILTINWNTQQICGVNWMSTVWNHDFYGPPDTSGIVNWNLKLCAQ